MVIIAARYLWDVSCPSNFAEATPSTPTQINSHFLSIRGIMSFCVAVVHVSHGSPSWSEKYLCCAPFALSPQGKWGFEQTVRLVFLYWGAVDYQKITQEWPPKNVLNDSNLTPSVPWCHTQLSQLVFSAINSSEIAQTILNRPFEKCFMSFSKPESFFFGR